MIELQPNTEKVVKCAYCGKAYTIKSNNQKLLLTNLKCECGAITEWTATEIIIRIKREPVATDTGFLN